MSNMDQNQIIEMLGNSLYAGSKPESIRMAYAYCTAAKLDIMQKPVHIVPMSTKDPASGSYNFRDVIMPGIGLYRIQADRSGTMAGVSEPEFGDDVEGSFKDKSGNNVKVTYPEWCKVTVSKLVGNHIVSFSAKEYWIENYATDSAKSNAPNAMWRKRPRGQLVKCAESQALRKGWPEVGQAPTAEEMEGKTIDYQHYYDTDVTEKLIPPDDKFEKNFPEWEAKIKKGEKTKAQIIGFLANRIPLTKKQIKKINAIEVT